MVGTGTVRYWKRELCGIQLPTAINFPTRAIFRFSFRRMASCFRPDRHTLSAQFRLVPVLLLSAPLLFVFHPDYRTQILPPRRCFLSIRHRYRSFLLSHRMAMWMQQLAYEKKGCRGEWRLQIYIYFYLMNFHGFPPTSYIQGSVYSNTSININTVVIYIIYILLPVYTAIRSCAHTTRQYKHGRCEGGWCRPLCSGDSRTN